MKIKIESRGARERVNVYSVLGGWEGGVGWGWVGHNHSPFLCSLYKAI